MPTILPTRGPFARGVSQLMYVGSADEALDRSSTRNTLVGAAAAAYALFGKGFAARAVAGGIAAWIFASRRYST